MAVAFLLGGVGLSSVMLITIFCVVNTISKGELRNRDYIIKNYACSLDDNIQERMKFLYEGVNYSQKNDENFYSVYRKKNEVVIIAVMFVNSLFDKNDYMNFVNEISELRENVINHTLIVVFIEKEKSGYLNEIIYVPEYNTLWDTKIFCVYNHEQHLLKVNRTNSGTGYKAYNDALKYLDQIFIFQENK